MTLSSSFCLLLAVEFLFSRGDAFSSLSWLGLAFLDISRSWNDWARNFVCQIEIYNYTNIYLYYYLYRMADCAVSWIWDFIIPTEIVLVILVRVNGPNPLRNFIGTSSGHWVIRRRMRCKYFGAVVCWVACRIYGFEFSGINVVNNLWITLFKSVKWSKEFGKIVI